jgi:pilus assembly protein Flp/PilA
MLRFYLAALDMLATVTARHERNDKGATAVEYGLMVALIAAAIIVMAGALGTEISNLFERMRDAVAGA